MNALRKLLLVQFFMLLVLLVADVMISIAKSDGNNMLNTTAQIEIKNPNL